ncbi:MAG: glycosyltransferase [Chlorobi bacterium]|nr:glycosyltransferase [Chlorobiota bacterium]
MELVFVGLLVYWLRIIVMAFGSWLEHRTAKPLVLQQEELLTVSIIVPARNEEHRISTCLDALSTLDYPHDRLEIIIVDDRSTDRTGQIARSYAERIPTLRVVSLTEAQTGNLQGKAGALDAGIQCARGEIILLTDADCAPHRFWARAHVAQYIDPRVAMVCAYTLIDGNSFFERYQAVEWNTTHTMASAGVYYRQYLGCFGNNMSFRRSVYHELGGYRSIPFSVTEDLALLQAVGATGRRVRYLCSTESSVTTEPCRTLGEYIRQHQRWVHGARALRWRAYVFVATTAVYWLSVVSSLVSWTPLAVAAIISGRIVADVILNIPPLVRLRRWSLIPWIVPTTVLFGFLELTLPLMALSRSVRWKDQVFVTVPPRTRTLTS